MFSELMTPYSWNLESCGFPVTPVLQIAKCICKIELELSAVQMIGDHLLCDERSNHYSTKPRNCSIETPIPERIRRVTRLQWLEW